MLGPPVLIEDYTPPPNTSPPKTAKGNEFRARIHGALPAKQKGNLFSVAVVYFCRGTLPKKRVKGHYWGTYNQKPEAALFTNLLV